MTHSSLVISPLIAASGHITPPGSKSIANRALPLAAMGKGEITIENLPDGQDVQLMLQALKDLGISIRQQQDSIQFIGMGGGFNIPKPINLFLGNSGTTTRFLTAILGASQGTYSLDGVPRMRERPISDLIDGLRQWSTSPNQTKFNYHSNNGFLPLTINAYGLKGGKAKLRGNSSSQFLTGMLLAMPLCQQDAEIEIEGTLVSSPYIDITLQMIQNWGVNLTQNNHKHFYKKGMELYCNPAQYTIEADASSASYFLAAGAIGKGPLTVNGVGTASLQYQSEGGFANVLKKMGAKVTLSTHSITVSGGELQGGEFNMDSMSDTGMTLAMVALFAKGTTTITHIGNWRLKETDRIKAMATELRKLGATVKEGPDYITITPPTQWTPATIETYEDHRMAMCFSLAAFGGVPITLLDPKCVDKTYPSFFSDFNKVTTA